MTVLITSFALAGYRSFGRKPQYVERLAKVNLFIGQNNAGKSNVIRFLHEVFMNAQSSSGSKPLQLDALAEHAPESSPILVGVGETIEGGVHRIFNTPQFTTANLEDSNLKSSVAKVLTR